MNDPVNFFAARRYREFQPRSICYWGAVVGGLLQAGGSVYSGSQSSKGAGLTAKAAEKATEFDQNMTLTNLAMGDPYRQAGYTALAGLMDMAGLSRGTPTPAGSGGTFNKTGSQITANGALPTDPGVGPTNTHTSPSGSTSTSNPTNGNGSDGTPSGEPGVRQPKLQNLVADRFYYSKPAAFANGGGGRPGFSGSDQEWVDFQNAYHDDPKAFEAWRQKIGSTPFHFDDYLNGGTRNNMDNPVSAGALDPNSQQAIDAKNKIPNLADKAAYDWQKDPGYEFRLSEGMHGLENNAAARGGLLSGAFAKSAMEFNQNFASNEYNNVFQRLAAISGIAVPGGSTAGANSLVGTTSDSILAGGVARGSAYINQGNAVSNGLNQVGSLIGNYFSNKPSGPSVGNGGSYPNPA